MRKNCKNKSKFSLIRLLILFLLLSALFYKLALGYYAAKYTESAHGNTSYGVNRTGLKTPINFGYSKGNCAHCHEQHGSIGGSEPAPGSDAPNNYLLFAEPNVTGQDTNFCFQCHTGTGSVQDGGILNYDYGSQFGGGAAKSTNIKDAFYFGKPLRTWNDGSSHNLENLRDWWKGRSGGDWVTSDTNACIVCHDLHYAQKNHGTPYPTLKTAIRLPDDPSSSNNRPRNLWGDEANSDAGNEIMSEFTARYQAPYRVGKTTYEPAGDSTSDGSNLPNFVDFCNTCHSVTIPKSKTDANVGSRALYAAKWGPNGNKHGKEAGAPRATSPGGHLIVPYTRPDAYNYVLSCTDCHEPHGSPNPFLLRTCVNGYEGKDGNGITVSIASGMSDWNYLNLYDFCSACHDIYIGSGTAHPLINDTNKYTYDCMNNGGCHTHTSYGPNALF